MLWLLLLPVLAGPIQSAGLQGLAPLHSGISQVCSRAGGHRDGDGLENMWATESLCGWQEASAHIWWPCSHPPIPEHSLTMSWAYSVFSRVKNKGFLIDTSGFTCAGQWHSVCDHISWVILVGCWHQVGLGAEPKQHSETMSGTGQPRKPHSCHSNAIKVFKDFLQKQPQMRSISLSKTFKELQIRSYAPSCPIDLSFKFTVTNQIVNQRAGSWVNKNSSTEVNSTAMLFSYQGVVQTSE